MKNLTQLLSKSKNALIHDLQRICQKNMKIQLLPQIIMVGILIKKDTVQHKFNELSGNDMRKRQAYYQVKFKGATSILRVLSCILIFCVPVSLVSRFFVLCFGVIIILEDLKAHS